jgi:hypothetical protein
MPDLIAFLKKFTFVVLFSANFNLAQSQVPSISIDGNPETEGISPAPKSIISGETFNIAVVVKNAQNLHSYSFKCQFDTQLVQFNGAVARLSPNTTAFLESNNGLIAAFLSIPGEGSIEIAATQSGNDSRKCVSGDGVLGYLSFTSKGNGDPGIALVEAHLVSPDGMPVKVKISQ